MDISDMVKRYCPLCKSEILIFELTTSPLDVLYDRNGDGAKAIPIGRKEGLKGACSNHKCGAKITITTEVK